MLSFEKHPYCKSLIVMEDGEQIDCIHYESISDLGNFLEQFYAKELLFEKNV